LFNLLDLGLTPAVIMNLSRAWHERDYEDMRRIIATGLTLFAAIGIIGGVAVALLVPWLVNGLLHVPAGLRSDARLALWLSALAFTLNMWLAVFNAIPTALERFDLLAARTIGLSLVGTVAVIVYALLGGGLVGLMIINLLLSVAGLLLFYLASRALLPSITFRPGFDRGSFQRLARFSMFKFAGTVGGILSFRFDQFAIAALVNVTAVGFYAIAAGAASRIFTTVIELVAPLFPRASKLADDPAHLRALYLRSTRIAFLVSTLLLSILFVYADLFLRYWIRGARGLEVEHQGTAALRWLALAFLIQSIAAVPAVFSEALGKPEINNGFSIAGAIIHIPLVLILVPIYGLTGAAIALCINSATQTVAFIVVAGRVLAGIGVRELWARSIARPLAAAFLASVLGYLLRGIVHGLSGLAVAAGVMALVYLGAALGLTAITRDDVQEARHALQLLPARLQGVRT
jgi:O-antigen/teichoic acid export membrane protein